MLTLRKTTDNSTFAFGGMKSIFGERIKAVENNWATKGILKVINLMRVTGTEIKTDSRYGRTPEGQ